MATTRQEEAANRFDVEVSADDCRELFPGKAGKR
jgi:hypothetical protein